MHARREVGRRDALPAGNADLPGNGALSALGAIRTINAGPFVDGKTQAVSGDTFYAVIEFSTPQRGEALLDTATGRSRVRSTSRTSRHCRARRCGRSGASARTSRRIWKGGKCSNTGAQVHGCTSARVHESSHREPRHGARTETSTRSRSRRGASGPRLRARICSQRKQARQAGFGVVAERSVRGAVAAK